MRLALAGLFRARWTETIHEEWIRSVLENRPDLTRAQLERTRQLMNAHVGDCLVVGFEASIPSLVLPDPADRHVLAAAIQAGADVIVTYNLDDFPLSALEPLRLRAQHPADFITHLFDLEPALVCEAVNRQRRALRQPPRSVEELLATFEQQGLSQTVARLRELGHRL